MSQHDYDISSSDTNTGSGFRSAVNAALQALVSNNSGDTAPTATFANMFWADTTGSSLKMRNLNNTDWITLGTLETMGFVTGGDNHNHYGGDGALIDHTHLISIGYHTHSQIDAHITTTSGNPHNVTKTDVGLSNVIDTEQVSKSDYTANTILAANIAATPITVTISEQRIVGRKTGGNIGELTGDEVYAVIGEPDNVESDVPTIDETTSGIKITLTAGEEISPFKLGCIRPDGKIWLAANNITYTPALYLSAETTISAEGSGVFLKFGFAKDNSWNWTPGSPLYVSDSGGNITQTIPSETDKVVQIVGFALSATVVDFSPIFSYLVLA